jgi:hypothetical protein
MAINKLHECGVKNILMSFNKHHYTVGAWLNAQNYWPDIFSAYSKFRTACERYTESLLQPHNTL